MNYETFQGYREAFLFDEIKVIGKDVCLNGVWTHFAGIGRKGTRAFFYFLEQQPPLEERADWRPGRTNRESMLEAGWSIPKDSPFYSLDWDCMGLAALELQRGYEKLPELAGPMEFTVSPGCKEHVLQIPVNLVRGGRNELRFSLEEKVEDEERITCYVNQVDVMEPLARERERFDDPAY